MFYKLKTAADGFPSGLKTIDEKLDYIKKIEIGDKIKLSLDEIKKQPGIRSVAKALSNNLWGKQAINLGRSQTVYFTKAVDFFKALRSPKISIDDLFIVNEQMIRVTMQPEDDFIPINHQGSLILAIMTTSMGRLFLYEHMQIVGHACMYVDTDSLFYIKRKFSPEIPLGPVLGQFKDELNGDKITCFVCCGPKSYGYKTSQNHVECHVKGFTLDYQTCKHINLLSMIKMVTQSPHDMIKVSYESIRRDRKDNSKIFQVSESKTIRFVFDKRIIRTNGLTVPYGYSGPPIKF